MRWLPVEVVHASFADKLERESAALAAALQELLAAWDRLYPHDGNGEKARQSARAALSKLLA